MKLSKVPEFIRAIFRSVKRLLIVSWKMDKRLTFWYFFTTSVGAIAPVLVSFFTAVLINNIQKSQGLNLQSVPLIIIVLLGIRYLISLLEGVVYWTINQSYLDYLLRNKLQNEVVLQFHKKLSTLDMAHFEDPKIQDLITKTRDTMMWQGTDFVRIFSYLLRDVIGYISAFIALIPFGFWIPFIITLITLPRLYFKARYGSIQWSMWGSGAPNVRKLWYLNYLLQEMESIRESRIAQSSSYLIEKMRKIQEYLYELNKKPLDRYSKVSTLPPFVEIVFIIAIAAIFLPQVLSGAMLLGTYTFLLSMLEALTNRAANASAKIGELYEKSLYIDHYFDLLDLKNILPHSNNPITFTDIKPPLIEFKNVTFKYANGKNVLQNINLTIHPGENVAFVGHNGAGKTTLVKLLCRFYDVTEGEILVNGVNIKELEITNWYNFLGTLFQEYVRYHFTVRENIMLGNPSKNDEEAMKSAAQKAGAESFIEELPNKYDQVLGREFEDGIEISGGQWQKLAIARAFYEEPPVLILDEPTSAIDAEAEYEIFNNLKKQYTNKTLVLVSHRFSTVRNADTIYVVSRGKIIERGSHEELMKIKGTYARMFTTQAKGYR